MQSVDQGIQPAIDQPTIASGKQPNMNVILHFKYFKIVNMYIMTHYVYFVMYSFIFMVAFMMVMLSTFFADWPGNVPAVDQTIGASRKPVNLNVIPHSKYLKNVHI